jgi:hypothetical protein
MDAGTAEIARRIESVRMEMEAKVGILRQHLVVLDRLYARVEQLPGREPIVDRGGPAGRVDH